MQDSGANNIQDQNIPSERKVYDAIYGFISFPKEIWQFVDSPHFQRLRNVRQLGCLSWVFPGAVHTRFEHCLGTGHLAQQYITTLIENHEKKQKINQFVTKSYKTEGVRYKSVKEEAIFIVTLAGILHDIGHGPYSHLFDSSVICQVKGKKWEHEIASLCLIDILYEYVIDARKKQGDEKVWLQSTKNRVKALIIGKIQETSYKEVNNYEKIVSQVDNLGDFNQVFKEQIKTRPWQFQIISNRLTGIDVDKLDYFRRDAYYLGAKNIYINHDLLMNQTLILKDKTVSETSDRHHRLCFPSKYSDSVYDVYYSRYKLFKTFYSNLKSKGIDLMLAQVLKSVKDVMNLKEACEDLLDKKTYGEHDTKYNHLTDSILERIEFLENPNEQVQKAIDLLNKLKKRDIYDFVCEYHKHYSFNDISDYYKERDALKKLQKNLQAKDKNFILSISTIGFGMLDKNPLQECKFYDKAQKKFFIEEDNKKFVSMLRPQGIVELSIRIYVIDRAIPEERRKIIVEELKEEVFKLEFVSGQRGTKMNRKEILNIGQDQGFDKKEILELKNSANKNDEQF